MDDACRKVIADAGYGEYFVHRTGHHIGQEDPRQRGQHGQPRDARAAAGSPPDLFLGRAPGIYQAEFGMHSEINVFVDAAGRCMSREDCSEKVVPDPGNRLIFRLSLVPWSWRPRLRPIQPRGSRLGSSLSRRIFLDQGRGLIGFAFRYSKQTGRV